MYDLREGICIGRLTKISGFKGYLKIKFYSEIIYEFEKETIFLDLDGKAVPFFVEYFQVKADNSGIIKFEETDSPEDAQRICGSDVYIPKNKVANNSQFESQIAEGFSVFNVEGKKIGVVKEVIRRKFQDLLVIVNNESEHLIPLHQEFIIKVDIVNKKLVLNPPEGIFKLSDGLNIV